MVVKFWLNDIMNFNEYLGSFIDFMIVDCCIYLVNKLGEMIIFILIIYRFFINILFMYIEKSDIYIELKILKGKIRI